MKRKLQALMAERTKALADAKAITDAAKAEDRGLSEEERVKLDDLVATADAKQAEADVVRGDIERIDKIETLHTETQTAQNQPPMQHTLTQPRVVGGAESRPYSHFGEFLMSVVRAETNMGRDPRLMFQERADAPGLGQNSVIPSEGGYLVPPNFSTMLLEQMMAESQILSMLDNQPITVGNGTTLPYVENTSRATGSRFGGVRAYWRQQGDTVDASKMKFGEMELKLKDLMAIGYVTEEMLSDAVFTGNMLSAALSAEMSFVAEDAVINGTGAGCPLGLNNAPCKVTVAKESGQAAASLNGTNVANMWARMPSRYRRTAIWGYNAELEPKISAMSLLSTAVSGATSATAAIPMVIPAGYGINQSDFSTLYNRPMIPLEYCAAPGTEGDLILFDPKQYLFITKGGMNTQTSMHVRFLYNEQTFRVTFRCDGQPKWKSSVTPYKGSNPISPVVTLAVRA